MDSIQYGKIQGFLLSLETYNNDALANGEHCEFTFFHVPEVGPLSKSLIAYIQGRIREASPGRVWRAKPVLEPVANWKEVLQAAFRHYLFWAGPPTSTVLFGQVALLMRLLTEFFGEVQPNVWVLRWSSLAGSEAYPWSVAISADWVFEHPGRGEWYHLTLIYSD